MIDKFALILSHGLLIIAAWRLLFSDRLDLETVDDSGPDNAEAGAGDGSRGA